MTVAEMLLMPGSTRDTVPRRPFATHTAPLPTATPVGVASSVIVLTSWRVFGSIRESVRSSRFATQTASSPTATAPGLTPVDVEPTTLFEEGSITATELGVIRGEPPELSPPTAKTRIATAAATIPSSAAPT